MSYSCLYLLFSQILLENDRFLFGVSLDKAMVAFTQSFSLLLVSQLVPDINDRCLPNGSVV